MANGANKARAILLSCDQGDLVESLDKRCSNNWSKTLCAQVENLDANYPGGVSLLNL